MVNPAITGIEREELIKELRDSTIGWWDKFNDKYKTNYPYPTMTFDLRGAVAGRASYQSQIIQYNLELFKGNKQDYFENTVPHEIAHLFNYRLNIVPVINNSYRYRIKPHGMEWQRVMIRMGLNPTRCHNYEVKKVRNVSRDFLYKCSCRNFNMTSIMHNKIVKGRWQKCLRCGTRLEYVGKVESNPISVTPTVSREELIKRMEEAKKQLALLEA